MLLLSLSSHQDLDSVWNPWVLGSWSDPKQRAWSGCGLVGSGDPRLRDARWVRFWISEVALNRRWRSYFLLLMVQLDEFRQHSVTGKVLFGLWVLVHTREHKWSYPTRKFCSAIQGLCSRTRSIPLILVLQVSQYVPVCCQSATNERVNENHCSRWRTMMLIPIRRLSNVPSE